MKNIVVVGFGYIGSVIGSVLADRGNSVIGVDTDKRIVECVNSKKSPFHEPGLQELIEKSVANKKLSATDDFSVIAKADVVLITVGTPLDDSYGPDLTHLKSATNSVAKYVQDGQLVILKSTIPPNTTKNLVAPLLASKNNVSVAYSPERLAEGKAIEELRKLPIVVGGVTPESTKRASAFWKEMLDVQVVEVQDSTTAELVKLADNLWIDLNIALAHELAQLSDKLSVDVLEVISAANTLPKGTHHVNILMPSIGVGGYCLTKDPWFVQKFGSDFGLEFMTPKTSRNVNDKMPLYSANIIHEILSKKSVKPSEQKVAIMGVAFKNNTGDCRFTPTLPCINQLNKLGYKLDLCDPWVADHDAKKLTTLPIGANIEETLKGASCVAFLAGHQDFKNIKISHLAKLVKPGALIFDGRMYFSRNEINEIRNHGLIYKGVGR